MAPVGLRFAGDAEAARAHAEAFARLTHPNAAAAECNVTYVGLLSAALHGAGDAAPATGASPAAGDPGALPAVPAPPGADDPAGPKMGWCRLTLHLAVRAAQDAAEVGPFEALVRLIGLGGDTDTNAAVAGGLLGAIYGAAAWPGDLVDQLALRGRMEQLAEGLWRAAQQ